MKIRIKGNSVRIRLSKSEVDFFGREGHLEEHTEFGEATLTYALRNAGQGDSMRAGFTNNCITLYIPENWIREWVDTQKVGFSSDMPLGNGKSLFLLLEKDFKCLDNTEEDQSDNYDNPLAEKIL